VSVLPWTLFPSEPVLEIGMRDGPQEETFQTSQRVSFSSGPWASSSMPLFSQLEVAPDGTIWLRAYQPFRREEVTDWYVMGSEGRFLGRGHIPSGFTVHELGTEDVPGVWTDEYDVQYVWRCTILR